MNLRILSVSYLNDCRSHAEWLHPFYASLQHELSFRGLDVEHFIVLNDESKIKAKKNIENIFSCYDLKFYEPTFISVNVDPVLKRSGSAHHGAGLNKGLEVISNDYRKSIKDSHLVLIEEFDLVHKKGYYSNLKSLYNFSRSHNSFFGSVDPGTLKISEGEVDRGENLGSVTEKRGEIESKEGDLYFWAPRILPHFFGFHSGLFESFFSKESGFRDEVTDYASHHTIENSSGDVIMYNDTGSDLIKDLFKDDHFFHMNDIEFLCHIKGITYFYDKILSSDTPNFDKKDPFSTIENKFQFVKSKFNYLPFPDNSFFGKDQFDKNLIS